MQSIIDYAFSLLGLKKLLITNLDEKRSIREYCTLVYCVVNELEQMDALKPKAQKKAL
jgi:hypothetical protein